MSLKLQIIGSQAAQSGVVASKTFDGAGGVIGRVPDAAWVLTGQYVSGRHAKIHFRDDAWFIEDTSSNGVFIGSQNNRLAKGELHRLQTGDRILIDDFEIAVIVDTPRRAAPPPPPRPAMRIPEEVDPFAMAQGSPLDVPVAGGRGTGVAADPLEALGLVDRSPRIPGGPRLADIDGNAGMRERVSIPPVREAAPPPPPAAPANAGFAIPDDYNPLGGPASPPPVKRAAEPAPPPRPVPPDPFQAPTVAEMPRPQPFSSAAARNRSPEEVEPPRRAPPPPPPPVLPAAATTTTQSTGRHPQLDLIALLEAAGVPSGTATPGLARELGQILRVVVTGLMDALRSRDKVKDEFRIRHTTFKATDNNPLKFSANVEDALYNLLVKRNPAYLGAVESFEDGFTDIRHHQMAMLVGMRMAYDAMLKRFDPQMLQEKFDETGRRGALLAMPARLRYWEQFSEHYRDMVKDPETSFRELFGAEFTSAYEEQLLRLRTLSRSQKRDS